MFLRSLLFFFTLLPCILSAGQDVYNYEKSPLISDETWERVKPYLLPSNHPIKKKLDEIFKKKDVLTNSRTVKNAGFPKHSQRAYSHCTVSPHPLLPGYFVKMYTEDVPNVVDYEEWIHRIEGAKSIQHTIDRNGYGKMFKVPKKWIYPLPSSSVKDPNGRNFVLIATDMKIYKSNRNRSKWKSDLMDKKRVKAMYTIIKENGLADSIYPFNIPFCKDGKQVFIDTEHHHQWPVHYEKLTPYFSIKMAKYFHELVHQDGN